MSLWLDKKIFLSPNFRQPHHQWSWLFFRKLLLNILLLFIFKRGFLVRQQKLLPPYINHDFTMQYFKFLSFICINSCSTFRAAPGSTGNPFEQQVFLARPSLLACPIFTNIPSFNLVTCHNMPPNILESTKTKLEFIERNCDIAKEKNILFIF